MGSIFRRLMVGVALAAAVLCAAAQAQEPEQTPSCAARALDVTLLTAPPDTAKTIGHLMAVELHNRSDRACQLGGGPEAYTLSAQKPQDAGSDDSDEEPDYSATPSMFEDQSYPILAPGDTAHFLIAWSSVPSLQREIGWQDNCFVIDRLMIGLSGRVAERLVELRHIGLQICGRLYLSPYRPGSYAPLEVPVPDRRVGLQLGAGDYPPIAAPETGIASGLSLRSDSDSDIQYLQGHADYPFLSQFHLVLIAPNLRDVACPYEYLRRRDAAGRVTVYFTRCDSAHGDDEHVESEPSARLSGEQGLVELALDRKGLLPRIAGRFDYEVVSTVRSNGRTVLASARLSLSVRNPDAPALPSVDTEIPECRAAQLSISAGAALHGHRSPAEDATAPFEEWHEGRIFEAVNISNDTCRLGGVPALKFAHPENRLAPPICWNCGSVLFKPRDSVWLDLRPKDAAHFIMDRVLPKLSGAAECDEGHQAKLFMRLGGEPVREIARSSCDSNCLDMKQVELDLPNDGGSFALPVDPAPCSAPARLSAWRTGRYDSDPLNIGYDRALAERDERRRAAALVAAIPEQCRKAPASGPSVMIGALGSLRVGLSTRPVLYGEPLSVGLWLDNETNESQQTASCSGIGWYLRTAFDVFDATGHRVLSRVERKNGIGAREPFVCSANFPVPIAAHSCAGPGPSLNQFPFVYALDYDFELPAGRYFIVPAAATADGRPVRRSVVDPPDALEITIGDP